ncbi:unnamed protein product, partial [Ectocarpus sp. 12 AP-2014]
GLGGAAARYFPAAATGRRDRPCSGCQPLPPTGRSQRCLKAAVAAQQRQQQQQQQRASADLPGASNNNPVQSLHAMQSQAVAEHVRLEQEALQRHRQQQQQQQQAAEE